MTTIEIVTLIDAPIETCFSLSLSIDLELHAARKHNIRAVSGVTSGTISGGERVQWKTRQFGITVSHLSEITAFQPPLFFQDSMIAGMFKSFEHDHFFEPLASAKTKMKDVLRFSMPAWLLGSLSETMIVKARLRNLLELRNSLIQETAPRQTNSAAKQ